MASPRTRLQQQQQQLQQQWEAREGAFEICKVGADNIGRHFWRNNNNSNKRKRTA